MKKVVFTAIVAVILVSMWPALGMAENKIVQLNKTLGGLKGDVQIVIDKYGIPHIYAENEADGMFALGYVHAKDRLWQMDFNRRAAQGRLSEVMGDATVEHDTFVRTIGLNRIAEASNLRAKENNGLYSGLTAYSWGVNSYVAEKLPEDLPVEFTKMDYLPGPWNVVDSLAIGRAMAWEMCGSLDDLFLATLVRKLGAETVDELFPIDRYNETPIIPRRKPYMFAGGKNEEPHHSAEIERTCQELLRMSARNVHILGKDDIGSNNWAIDGRKSLSGKPILASDPHLGFHLPSIWYIAHIKAGSLDVIGVTMPGLPGVIIGHNRHMAWGVTNTQADVTDFFVEKINAEGTHYIHRGEWKPLEIVKETIEVRGEAPHELTVYITAHGPILPGADEKISIQWIGAEPDDDTLALQLLNRAVDYDDFAVVMQTWNAPPMNFVYADTNGMIAMWVAGLFPIRKSGMGRFPVDGASGGFDWEGFIPRMDTPHIANPSQRYLASANQRPATEGYPYYLGYEWDPGYRARRINQLLSSSESITAARMKEFQTDAFDVAAEAMLPRMIAACGNEFEEGKLYARALSVLSKWDYVTTEESSAPTIWWNWLEEFSDAVWRDEWDAAGIEITEDSWGHTGVNKWRPPLEVLERITVEEPNSKWFDDVSTDTRETIHEIASSSLRRAVDKLMARLGGDIPEWNWGIVNRLRIPHLSGDPMLGRGGHPLKGSALTLNARGAGEDVTNGPSWRMVVDFADLKGTTVALPGGQSGDPASPHYDDLIDMWARDQYIPLLFPEAPEEFFPEQTEAILNLSAPGDSFIDTLE